MNDCHSFYWELHWLKCVAVIGSVWEPDWLNCLSAQSLLETWLVEMCMSDILLLTWLVEMCICQRFCLEPDWYFLHFENLYRMYTILQYFFSFLQKIYPALQTWSFTVYSSQTCHDSYCSVSFSAIDIVSSLYTVSALNTVSAIDTVSYFFFF